MRLSSTWIAFAVASASASIASANLYTGAGGAIPDSPAAGTPGVASFVIPVADAFTIDPGVVVTLSFGRGPSGTTVTPGNREHTWSGDLIVTLTSPGGSAIDIMNRLGKTSSTSGFGRSDDMNGTYIFTDTASVLLTSTTPTSVAAGSAGATDTAGTNIPQGTYRAFTNVYSGVAATTNPAVSLDTPIVGTNALGNWTLTVSDHASGDVGDLVGWSILLPGVIPEPTTLGALAAFGLVALRRRK
jgi:hypothetical protein